MNELDAVLEPAPRLVCVLIDEGVSIRLLKLMLQREDVRVEMSLFWWTDRQKKRLDAAVRAIGWEIHWVRWRGHSWDIAGWEMRNERS